MLQRRHPMHESMIRASLLDEMPEVAPLDEHNRALVAHVHPTDWQNPPPRARYNLVVIGGGTAGLVSAAGAVEGAHSCCAGCRRRTRCWRVQCRGADRRARGFSRG